VRPETLGVVSAILTALCWAVAVILFKKAGTSIAPLPLNLLKTTIGLTLVTLTYVLLGEPAARASRMDYLMLAGSGALGVGVADLFVLRALMLTGASRQAIIESVYSPAVVVISYFMLGERLSPVDGLGGGLILLGVIIAGQMPADELTTRRDQFLGFVYGATAMVMMALAIVAVKPILERFDVFFCTMIRLLGGFLAMLVIAATRGGLLSAVREAFRLQPSLRYAVPGAIMSTYLSIVLWVASFKYAPAGIAALLNQTSTLFIVVLAILLLREPLTLRVAIAVVLCLSGSVLVLL
jgi:drug/metabolite transporter (DMT)-like permease